MPSYTAERTKQFRTCVEKMSQLMEKDGKALCIFGGDLNIRDNEVSSSQLIKQANAIRYLDVRASDGCA